MKDLNHSQYRRILRSVEILNSDIAPETLPQRLIAAANCAVSGDIAAFEMTSPAGEYQGCLIYEPLDAISPKELEIYNQYVNEHPFYSAILFNRRFDAIKIADFMSDGKFSNTGIYNEYYRPLGVNRQISVTMEINAECLLFGTLSRRGSDFSEAERAMLNLLSPHFTAAFRHTKLYERRQTAPEKLQAAAESAFDAEVIVLDSEGKIKYLSAQAARLVEKYFAAGKLKVRDLPDSFYRWVLQNIENSNQTDEFYFPLEPLVITTGGEKLTIRFSRNPDSIILLLDEEKIFSAQNLVHLGLTKRETEILYWIATGKSNSEIAALCGISLRTVQKHTERIYTKLGVENRTAAMLRALEIL